MISSDKYSFNGFQHVLDNKYHFWTTSIILDISVDNVDIYILFGI
jgi:hypothetical protein